MVSLLPCRTTVLQALQQQHLRLQQQQIWRLRREQERLLQRSETLSSLEPRTLLSQRRSQLKQRQELLDALSPDRWLNRGFAKVIRTDGSLLQSASQAHPGDDLVVQVHDGLLEVKVATVRLQGRDEHCSLSAPCTTPNAHIPMFVSDAEKPKPTDNDLRTTWTKRLMH